MRALVVVCRYLGDTLLATPLAQALHRAGYEVDWVVAPGSGSIIEQQAYARRVFQLKPNVGDTLGLMRKLFHKYELACVINGADRPMLVALAAAKRTFALIPDRWQDRWKAILSSDCIHNQEGTHIVRYAMELAELAGVPPVREVRLEWSGNDRRIVEGRLGWEPGSFIHIHPFARWPYKHWPESHWQCLMQAVVDHGLHLAITAGPNDAKILNRLVEGFDPACVKTFCGELSWPQIACLSSMARCYVGLDTANTHVAASTGVPVVALFGPTNPTIWGPWPNRLGSLTPYRKSPASGNLQIAGNIHLLQGAQACVPCHREGCEQRIDSRSECLDSLQPSLVWDTVVQAMETGQKEASQ